MTDKMQNTPATLPSPSATRAWSSELNPDGGWIVSVEGTATPGAKVQIKSRSGEWRHNAPVDADGRFAFNTGYYEDDGLTLRQVLNGEISPESGPWQIAIGVLLSVDVKGRVVVIHIQFSKNILGAFNYYTIGDREGLVDPLYSEEIEDGAPVSTSYELKPGQYTVWAYAGDHHDGFLKSVDFDVQAN